MVPRAAYPLVVLSTLVIMPAAGRCVPPPVEGANAKTRSVVGTWHHRGGVIHSYFTLRANGRYSFYKVDARGRKLYKEDGKYTWADGRLLIESTQGQRQTMEVSWKGNHRASFRITVGPRRLASTFKRIRTR
jgi:hypothetical protein